MKIVISKCILAFLPTHLLAIVSAADGLFPTTIMSGLARDVLIYFTREYIHYSHGYESTFIRVPFNMGQMGIGLRDGRLVDYGYTLMTCHRQLHHGVGLHYKVSKQTGGAWLLEDIKRFNRIAAQKPYPDAPPEGAWTPDHKEVVTVDNLLEIFPQRFS